MPWIGLAVCDCGIFWWCSLSFRYIGWRQYDVIFIYSSWNTIRVSNGLDPVDRQRRWSNCTDSQSCMCLCCLHESKSDILGRRSLRCYRYYCATVSYKMYKDICKELYANCNLATKLIYSSGSAQLRMKFQLLIKTRVLQGLSVHISRTRSVNLQLIINAKFYLMTLLNYDFFFNTICWITQSKHLTSLWLGMRIYYIVKCT